MWKILKRHWPLVISVIYLISPIDFIPEALVWLLGPAVIIDDTFLLIIAILHAIWQEYKLHQEHREPSEKYDKISQTKYIKGN